MLNKFQLPKAVGATILVEILTPKESYNSILLVPDNSKMPALQGYILHIGPAVNAKEYGIAEGDRVVLWGEFSPVPRHKDDPSERKLGIYPPHAVKAVINYE